MTEQLPELEKRFPGITPCFGNFRIVLAIPDDTDRFEASVWRRIDKPERVERDFRRIALLLAIVDELNLNLRIWSKE